MNYWLKVDPVWEGKHIVRYGIPGVSHVCEHTVDENMAQLLEIALQAGRNAHIDELNHAMGKR